MPAPLIGLPALLQAIATIGVGGAVGYKAKKDLEPLIKELQSSPKDMDSSELKMLRALFMPTQAVASGLKENISEFGLKVPGVIAPDADEMEKVRQDIEKNLKPGETKSTDQKITDGNKEYSGSLGFNYDGAAAILIKAVSESKAILDDLNARVTTLEG